MKFKLVTIAAFFAALTLGFATMANAQEPPVAKLVQVSGDVTYSRNGQSWNPVRRTKYLFAGYQIKTGTDGSGKLINQETGMSQELGPNTEITVQDKDIEVVSGSLSKPKQESTSIFQGLSNKFAKAQRYTTVRRSINKGDQGCDNKVRTISEVTLSASHPDLVWRNACPEYSYRLIVDGNAVEIPAQSTSEMIRYTISGVSPGEHTYRVEVLDNDGTVYIPRKDSNFTWLDAKADKKLEAQLASVGDDVFQAGGILEQSGMFIAVMDTYRDYFNENPDDNDMRPLLIQSYNDLKLSNLRESEARLYNASLEEGF